MEVFEVKDTRKKPKKPLDKLVVFKKMNLQVHVQNETKHIDANTDVQEVDLNRIHTDLTVFQNREDEYSEESVNRIKNAVANGSFRFKVFDPVLLWHSPKDGKLYILSGHSRTEAFRELAKEHTKYEGRTFDKIPAKIISVSKAEAEKIAMESNTLSTKETDLQRAAYYKKLRQNGTAYKELKETVKDREGANANRILAFSYLNPKGYLADSIRSLEKGDTASRATIQAVGQWIGECRRLYPQLTDLHETELAKWMIQDGGYGTKTGQISSLTDFREKVDYLIHRQGMFFDPTQPLNVKNAQQKSAFKQEWEKRLDAAKTELAEAKKELDEKQKKFAAAGLSIEDRLVKLKPYNIAVTRATDEVEKIKKQYGSMIDAERSQQSLFGLGAIEDQHRFFIVEDLRDYAKAKKEFGQRKLDDLRIKYIGKFFGTPGQEQGTSLLPAILKKKPEREIPKQLVFDKLGKSMDGKNHTLFAYPEIIQHAAENKEILQSIALMPTPAGKQAQKQLDKFEVATPKEKIELMVHNYENAHDLGVWQMDKSGRLVLKLNYEGYMELSIGMRIKIKDLFSFNGKHKVWFSQAKSDQSACYDLIKLLGLREITFDENYQPKETERVEQEIKRSVAPAQPKVSSQEERIRKFNALAERMRKAANAIYDRLKSKVTNTPKRQREYDSARCEADRYMDIAVLSDRAAVEPELSILTPNADVLGQFVPHSEHLSYYSVTRSKEPMAIKSEQNREKLAKELNITKDKILEIARFITGTKSAPKPPTKEELVSKVKFSKIPGFFPTPKPLAEKLVGMAKIKSGDRVLEPEAGIGSLIEAVHEHHPDVDVDFCETHYNLREILQREPKTHCVGNDFLEYKPEHKYDVIIMNPPFENGQDMEHVTHAIGMLADGGRLVAIMGAMAGLKNQKKDQAFAELLKANGATIEKNPEGSFKSGFVSTGVNTKTVFIEKRTSAANEVDEIEFEKLLKKSDEYSEEITELGLEAIKLGYNAHGQDSPDYKGNKAKVEQILKKKHELEKLWADVDKKIDEYVKNLPNEKKK